MAHKHYVPILKGKRGDFWALENLKDTSRSRLTPLIEMMPPADAGAIPAQTKLLAKAIRRAWGASPVLVDMLWVAGAAPSSPKKHAVAQFADEARKLGLAHVPVTGLSRGGPFQAAIAGVAATDGAGVAIRLAPNEFGGEELCDVATALEHALDQLLGSLEVERSDVDLIVDFRSVYGVAQHLLRPAYEAVLEALPSISDWRSLIVAAGSFPEDIAPFSQDQWNGLPRCAWLTWRGLVTGKKAHAHRRPAYGDYGIRHPNLPYQGFPNFAANLRYSAGDKFFVWRGRAVKTHPLGNRQMHNICADLVARPEFSGKLFSAGDAQIEAAAKPASSPGNPESWGKWATNHYLELVCDQIANCPGL
jgi:hypothetical protein